MTRKPRQRGIGRCFATSVINCRFTSANTDALILSRALENACAPHGNRLRKNRNPIKKPVHSQ
jgi:hypothetical protein